MSTRADFETAPITEIAFAISRALSWGLPAPERSVTLIEERSDWEAMAAEYRPTAVLWRAIRGIPTAVWTRLGDGQVTAIPAGTALSALGLTGLAAGGVGTAYPDSMRVSIAMAGLGTLVLGLTLIAEPRRIIARRHIIPAGVAAIGFTGMAFSIPTDDGWAGGQLPSEAPIFDTALAAIFVVVGVGFALASATLTQGRATRFTRAIALTIAFGLGALAVTEATWAVFIAPHDLAITIPTIGASLAAASAAHVVPRLRHLEIT